MVTKGFALLAISCLGLVILCCGGSIEDDMEMEARLRILNKPPVITFERGGFIIDCVDFYKQPAFDNPLLKNHSIPKGAGKIMPKRSRAKQMLRGNRKEGFEGCPDGTVPIRRFTRQDLLREKSLHNLHLDFVDPSSTDNPSYHAANLRIFGHNILGTRASVGIHIPHCEGNQMTGSFIRMLGTFDGSTDNIYAGWAIYPQLYGGDVKPHITIYWSNRARAETGCFNTLCPGFVQVDADVMPGNYFGHTSVYDGPQSESKVEIHQDVQTKHWWFIMDNKKVGYWPKELFSNLDGGAHDVLVGGVAISDENNVAPQMGFGNYPRDMISEAGYMRHIEFANATEDAYDPLALGEEIRTKNCFGLRDLGVGKWNGYTILFGGPGGFKCH